MPLVASCTKCRTENNVTGNPAIEEASHGLTLWPCPGCGTYCIVREVGRTEAPRPQQMLDPAPPDPDTKPDGNGRNPRQPETNEWTEAKLPGLEGGRAQKTADVPEEVIQRETVKRLESYGYLVEQTTVRIKAQVCPKCSGIHGYNPLRRKGQEQGAWGYGTTPTIADLLVRNPKWAPALWVQLEIKGSKTPVDDTREGPQGMTQRDMMIGGHVFVCRSAEAACRYIARIEQLLREYVRREEVA